MAIKKIRVILDTNWYISATINKKSRRTLYELITNNHLSVLFSNEILKEYQLVIARGKFKKIINSKQSDRFINLAISRLESIELKSTLTGSRDEKDNFLLSLCLDGKADYLVTGDADLLVLEETSTTQIVTLSAFLEIIAHKTQ